jgi:hypothetical protein
MVDSVCVFCVTSIALAMGSFVCTLAEGKYHIGVGALVNSLHAAGFRGWFYCGYRGKLPDWFKTHKELFKGRRLMEVDGIHVVYVPLETDIHFTNYKPQFMLDILDELGSKAQRIFYFDPDIVVKCRMQMLEWWCRDGVALCEGSMGNMPDRHPLRIGWREWLKSQGYSSFVPRDKYFNAGFVGVENTNTEVLKMWQRIIEQIGQANGTLDKLVVSSRDNIFYIPDEYALNMALMCSVVNVNSSGLEGMDFKPQGNLLSHYGGRPKPWDRHFIRGALKGQCPTLGARLFAKMLVRPLRVMPQFHVLLLRFRITLAAQISRFIKQTQYACN